MYFLFSFCKFVYRLVAFAVFQVAIGCVKNCHKTRLTLNICVEECWSNISKKEFKSFIMPIKIYYYINKMKWTKNIRWRKYCFSVIGQKSNVSVFLGRFSPSRVFFMSDFAQFQVHLPEMFPNCVIIENFIYISEKISFSPIRTHRWGVTSSRFY